MSQHDRNIHKVLERTLLQEGFDLTDLVPVPLQGDRIMRIRTLEEAFDGFLNEPHSGEDISYIVKIRPRKINLSDTAQPPISSVEGSDKVYRPDGSLNVAYLEHSAELLLCSGEYTLARNIYQTIYQSGQRAAQSLAGMGLCYEREGRSDLAIEKYEASITYHPSIDIFYRLIGLLIAAKKDRSAAEVIARALSVKDVSDEIRFELYKAAGNCWLRSDREDEAEHSYRRALEIRPSADEVRANLGWLYIKKEQWNAAKRCFQDALASRSQNDSARTGLAKCFEMEGLSREAYEEYARSLEVNLAQPQALYRVIALSFELKQYGPAERVLSSYCDTQPLNTHILYSLAAMQFHLGKIQAARQTVQKILDVKPGHSGAKELAQRMSRYA